MKSFEDIITDLGSRVDCHFHPGTGLPNIPSDLRLPSDLAAFYARFSEAQLFGDKSDPRCHLLSPDEFIQVGAAMMGQVTKEGIERSWYALAHVQDGNYVAIDLLPTRLGWCYDCFHETYGELGDCKIISLSFTEFLNRLAEAGDGPFWLEPGFDGYGDAYDKTQ